MLHLAIALVALLVQTSQPTTVTNPTTPALDEREVAFVGVGGAKLSGTIALVENRAVTTKSPAVLFVCGSGPTDRDGNQRPALVTDTQKQMAVDLARRGIASLRYDKRGVAGSAAGAPRDQAGMTEFYAWENFVEDVIAAYRTLQQQPEIDPNRVALVGHSEGGLLVLVAANQVKDKERPPAAMVLLATPGRPIDALITEQLARLVKRQGANDSQAKRVIDKAAEIAGQIRATGAVPANVPRGLQALYPPYLGKFFRSMFAVEPARLAANFDGPVLVINGDLDQNVSADLDAKALDAALRARTPARVQELMIVTGASHSLKSAASELDPGFAGPIVPAVLDKIGAFLQQNLRDPSAVGR